MTVDLGSLFRPPFPPEVSGSNQVGLRHEKSFDENVLLRKREFKIRCKYIPEYFCQLL